MFPTTPSRFPEFVSDQVLTASNLNSLFGYLDEQERMTRADLIGIGIVCGLEVRVSSTGDAVTVTKGVGVTSSGYLVVMPQTTYQFYNDEFSAEKERYYDRFVDLSTKKQRFPLFELAVAGSPEAKKPLSADVLKDKVALIFVELLEVDNKNCDPDSCDDKGTTVTVTFRPLLVAEKDAEGLIGTDELTGFSRPGQKCAAWPEVKMPRYNVPATSLPDSARVLKQYLNILTEPFLTRIENTLSAAYSAMQSLVVDTLPQNPFAGLKDKFHIKIDGSVGPETLVHVQYFYDFFSDLLQGYDELRSVCNRLTAICCPDENLFPRHLLLGALSGGPKKFRHYFIPSPAVCCGDSGSGELRALLLRLARLVGTVNIPAGSGAPNQRTAPIRITPSTLGTAPLSQKAIPYYYDVLAGDPPLFELWNYRRSSTGKGRDNLSYHAVKYNASDDQVRSPLRYDLEPYNFFRIEGHIGTPWQKALAQISELRHRNRLPFDVIALNGDLRTLLALLRAALADVAKVLREHPEQWKKILCLFSDIELQYDVLAAELRCTLGKAMRFLYSMTLTIDTSAPAGDGIPISGLLRTFDPSYRYAPGTFGSAFEILYPKVKDLPYGSAAITGSLSDAGRISNPLALMYYLEKIHEALPAGIVQLQLSDLSRRLDDSAEAANALARLAGQVADNVNREEYLLTLNAVSRVCKAGAFKELYRNFLFRFAMYLQSQSFALYSFLQPGIQHKAGVPVGGTFILVYHDADATRLRIRDLLTTESVPGTASDFSAAPSTGVGANRVNLSGASASVDASAVFDRSKLTANERVFTAGADLSKIASVKNAGMFVLDEVLAIKQQDDEPTDKELLNLIAEIPDGTVIADFYVPYVCSSDCPPINFIVLDRGESTPPADLSISIEPKQYCNDDTTPRPITVSPDGGTVTSDAGGVTSPSPGAFVFVAAQATAPTGASRTVTLTYTKDSASVSTSVEVFRKPKASFQFTVSGRTVAFNNLSDIGSPAWTFGDGQSSVEQNPVHTYAAAGTFPVVLTMTNGACTSSVTLEIVIQATPAPAACTDLRVWFEAFRKLDSDTTAVFKKFQDAYPLYRDIRVAFTQQMPPILGESPNAQVDKLAQFMAPPLIQAWMKALQPVILEQADLRRYGFEVQRILNGILLFYACVQKEDIDAARVPTERTFRFENTSCIQPWLQIASTLTAPDKAVLTTMSADVKKELDNAPPAKPKYIAILKQMLELLKGVIG